MIVIHGNQFKRLMAPIPNGDSISFNQFLIDLYGIKEMKAHSLTLYTDWDVYFVNDNAELIFKLKYGEYL